MAESISLPTLPEGFLVRPATMDDLDAVAELLFVIEKAKYGKSESTVSSYREWIRSVWETPGFQLATDSWIVVAPDRRCVGYITLWRPEHAPEHMVASPRVHPTLSWQGIELYLLRRAEMEAREKMAKLAPEVQGVFNSWVDGPDAEAEQMLMSEEFTASLYFLRMEIELQEMPTEPAWPAGITISPYVRGQDDRAVFDALEDAFRDTEEYEPGNFDEWCHDIFTRENFDPSLWMLLMEGDQIIGTALCWHDVGEEGSIGLIESFGIRPPWRKRGLALMLLQHCFGEFYHRCITRCGLNVDVRNFSATRLYERAGMQRVPRYEVRYQKTLREASEMQTLNG
jgi:mycothiol synthase